MEFGVDSWVCLREPGGCQPTSLDGYQTLARTLRRVESPFARLRSVAAPFSIGVVDQRPGKAAGAAARKEQDPPRVIAAHIDAACPPPTYRG